MMDDEICYSKMKNKKTIQGIFAIVFALFLTATLTMRIIYVFTICTRVLPAWFVFYRFTYLTNYLVIVYLFLFGISHISKKLEKLKKITTHSAVLIALAFYCSILFFYFFIAISSGMIVFEGYSFLHHVPRRIFTYILTPIIIWIFFFIIKRNPDEIKQNKIKTILVTLAFPVTFFLLNMIIGHMVTYGANYPAFAYEFLSPAFHSWWLFTLAVFAAIAVFSLLTYLLIFLNNKIKKRQQKDKT